MRPQRRRGVRGRARRERRHPEHPGPAPPLAHEERGHADQEVPGVGDGRVRQHPLHVPLREREQVPDDHRQERERREAGEQRVAGNAGPSTRNTRTIAANAAAFTAALIIAVTGVGAPS